MAQRGLTPQEIARYWALERGEIPARKPLLQVGIPEPLYRSLMTAAKLSRKAVRSYVERDLRRALGELEEKHGPIMPPPPTPS